MHSTDVRYTLDKIVDDPQHVSAVEWVPFPRLTEIRIQHGPP